MENHVYSKNTLDDDFRLSLIENSNYDGTMIWKIPQFSQRMEDARSGKYTSIFSLPFYSSRYGYKMCLRLYILGDGIGKNTHMSLFFVCSQWERDGNHHQGCSWNRHDSPFAWPALKHLISCSFHSVLPCRNKEWNGQYNGSSVACTEKAIYNWFTRWICSNITSVTYFCMSSDNDLGLNTSKPSSGMPYNNRGWRYKLRLYHGTRDVSKIEPEGEVFDTSDPEWRDITSLCPVSLAYPESLHAVEVTRAAVEAFFQAFFRLYCQRSRLNCSAINVLSCPGCFSVFFIATSNVVVYQGINWSIRHLINYS